MANAQAPHGTARRAAQESAKYNSEQLSTRYGTVTYERGFDLTEVEGWVQEEGAWLLIFGDRSLPARRQRHTAIPVRRIVEVDLLVADV